MVMNRDQVFISYSRKDSEWLEKLKTILAPLERKGKLNLWTDANIQPGKLWKEEIQQALVRAKVAVLLVSPDFLASDFIDKHELPLLLEAAKKEELIILWVLIKPCLYQETEIANYQAAYDLDKPLSQLEPHCREAALITIAKKISEATQIRDVSEEQQERLSKPQSICKNIPGQNPLDAIEEKKARSDLLDSLKDSYPGSYSTQKMLLDAGMRDFHSLRKTPSNSITNEILLNLISSYYPSFSTILMLFKANIKSYEELNE